MKIIKVILSLLVITLLSYIGYQYYQFTSFREFIKQFKNSGNELSVSTALTSSFDHYGELWPKNKKDLDSVLDRIKFLNGQTDRLYIEKYGYNIHIDTVMIDTDTLKVKYIAYKLYSYGPDKKDDQLKNLPFNNLPMEYTPWGIPIKEITFWEYLFMDKNFDVVLVYASPYYNCENKKYSQVNSGAPQSKSGRMQDAYIIKPVQKRNGPLDITYIKKYEEDKENSYTKTFNQTLKTIRENLTEQYPDTPTEGLIFNYNGKRVRCICSFNVPDAPVTTIEKILTEKLNATANYIGMTAFYMEVPVLQ
ncbi:hypothetical protein SAMN02927921_03087 [Sinomicrobium oceani]|uniref:Uncharacterized protein n=1 Tax=Sinomicrobium oceani TaxID=1150368 RepID=A0A1K1R1N2_9FLAO|nr:hypothetical protein [Sinomicrobium oceani]SFW66122.1 hypothetical protein SAMN02927921_03087 [Sinomicrobium oceani]